MLYLLQDQNKNNIKEIKEYFKSQDELNIRPVIKELYNTCQSYNTEQRAKKIKPKIAELYNELVLQYIFFDYARQLYKVYIAKSKFIDNSDNFKKAVKEALDKKNFFHKMNRDPLMVKKARQA
jgi:hypothetical protein|tara:strand:- start:14477 stop:14845 length:369 start_codon:yes stop_codon:yes gene_type:complete